jgi:hypothetical protein
MSDRDVVAIKTADDICRNSHRDENDKADHNSEFRNREK